MPCGLCARETVNGRRTPCATRSLWSVYADGRFLPVEFATRIAMAIFCRDGKSSGSLSVMTLRWSVGPMQAIARWWASERLCFCQVGGAWPVPWCLGVWEAAHKICFMTGERRNQMDMLPSEIHKVCNDSACATQRRSAIRSGPRCLMHTRDSDHAAHIGCEMQGAIGFGPRLDFQISFSSVQHSRVGFMLRCLRSCYV